MNDTASETETKEISLLDSLAAGEWLKLPNRVMIEVGPAVQTLGGLLEVTNKANWETFASVETIAGKARLPVKTARNQLDALTKHGWITNDGRGKTRRGAPRRTCTLRLAGKTLDALYEYHVLPWWACCSINDVGRLAWSTKAVLAVVMARLMSCKKTVDDLGSDGENAVEKFGQIENLGERFLFTLERLHEMTGLSRRSCFAAKIDLCRLGIINVIESERRGMGKPADQLKPNPDFRAVISDAGNGPCVAFKGWSEFGK